MHHRYMPSYEVLLFSVHNVRTPCYCIGGGPCKARAILHDAVVHPDGIRGKQIVAIVAEISNEPAFQPAAAYRVVHAFADGPRSHENSEAVTNSIGRRIAGADAATDYCSNGGGYYTVE